MVKFLVCGSRGFDDYDFFAKAMKRLYESLEVEEFPEEFEVVSGGAKGADTFAKQYASEVKWKYTEFKPDWKKYGRAAGPIRNGQMLEYLMKNEEDSKYVIAFWDGQSKGTQDMMNKARKAGCKVVVVEYR